MRRSRCLQRCQNLCYSLVNYALKTLVFSVFFFSGALPTSIASAPTAQAQQIASIAATTTPPVEDALACNCYAYVRSLIPSLPLANKLEGNSPAKAGAVAIFDYHGLPHYGIVVSISGDGFMLQDSNFKKCKYLTHFISWNDPAIEGFWSP